ncbi:hypothetical protein FA13DRAFT_1735071 [Coprinellus micaceus]|uniref:F-box domain-containing protein n=1 Tax=Coprinellus micaceus TaxID=71717 RepID=A0A4Y7T449_COPMI|nr:hypothetical protein FA13DRAFT_1735071 [Coprinellus micaceus]
MDRLPALSRLLTSNDPPQPFELVVIENVVSLMDETIANLTAQLDKAKNERQQCQALLSPLRRMPMDVLGEIFGHVVSSAESYNQGLRWAVELCLVCRTWQDAAYATHRLWASFELQASGDWREWKRVDRWMKLSGALPKKISVYSNQDICHQWMRSPALPCQLAVPRLARLLAEGQTIHTLSISCPHSRCVGHLCAAVGMVTSKQSRPWDGIECLHIEVRQTWTESSSPEHTIRSPGDSDPDSDAEEEVSFLQQLPLVKSFHLNTPSSATDPNIAIPNVFLSNLTTLSIDNDWDGCAVVKILRLLHQGNLEQLIFGCKSGFVEHLNAYTEGEAKWVEGIPCNPKKMFVLPHLRILKFHDLHPSAFKIALFFKAPSLVELELGFRDVEDVDIPSDENSNVFEVDCEDMLDDIPVFIERSSCQASLRRLTFSGGLKLHMHDLEDWLIKKWLPSLSRLTFDGVYLPPEFFKALQDRYYDHDLDLDHILAIELLNLPTECHCLGLYLRELRRMVRPGDRSYLSDTDIVVTIKEREESRRCYTLE